VAAGAEHVEGAPVPEEHRLLGFLHDQLRAELDLRAPGLREPEHDLLASGIVVLEDLQSLRHHRPPFSVTSSKILPGRRSGGPPR